VPLERLGRSGCLGMMGKSGLLGKLVRRASLVRMAFQDCRARLGHQARMERPAMLAPQVVQALPEHVAFLARVEPAVLPAPSGRRVVLARTATQARAVLLGHPGMLVNKDFRASWERPGRQARCLGRRVRLAPQGWPGRLGLLATMDPKVSWEARAALGRTGMLVRPDLPDHPVQMDRPEARALQAREAARAAPAPPARPARTARRAARVWPGSLAALAPLGQVASPCPGPPGRPGRLDPLAPTASLKASRK